MSTSREAAEALTEAAQRHDRTAAWHAVGPIVSEWGRIGRPLPFTEVFELVWSAANNRWFDIAEVLAGAAAGRADATPDVCRLHAQMMMERGFTGEALLRLESLLQNARLSEFDQREARGHLGRIYKDQFVKAAAAGDARASRAALASAIEHYLAWYRHHPDVVWHGINAVALLARPEARDLRSDAVDESRRLATLIVDELRRQPGNRYRDAIHVEAQLALGDPGKAVEALRRYVADRNVSVFSLSNLLRQLRDVWRLDDEDPPAPALLAIISDALLARQDGVLHLAGVDIQRARAGPRTEAVFGTDRFDSLDNYRRGLERCACVARIGRTADVGVGTGSVLPGRLLCDKLDDRFVLVTTAHVVSTDDAERAAGALHPSEAVVTFAAMEGVPPDKEFGVTRVLCSSPRGELDMTVLELSEPVQPRGAYPVAEVLPVRGAAAQVRVIGHPSGRGLSISVNQLLDHETPKLHYRTATEGGSSGSPVFNQDWRLIGLHHAGGDAVPKLNGQTGTYQANEGIWIRAIAERLTRALAVP